MSIQVATAEGADLLWGNQKWVSTNPSRASSHSTDDQEKLSQKTTTPILPMPNTETKKGTAATIGKKRERGEAKKTGKGKGPKGKEGKPICESDHGVHIWTERERRKKMRNMFANLHSLLPQLPPKFNICSPPPPAASGTIFTAACYVLEKHGIEVLSAHVSSNSDRRLLMIQARHNRSENNGGGRDHVLGADDRENVVAEIFKQAAAEMLSYLCSSPN
ncbi:unnamed protein product [Linum tenue]|uniref:BHLH domain-containing protein n=1 Tax=Linum tenue TaxID=586396 RepID=A0AAV0MP53_9ROSI|nr:unnamed protein product [Linum tenue]